MRGAHVPLGNAAGEQRWSRQSAFPGERVIYKEERGGSKGGEGVEGHDLDG